ncbi:hypothetical protein [Tepidimonas charontis]|uniref:TRAP transporter solute receptor, TAXI family n=1 Tax=Tepidimonas charontis TaxID=2267262 RepID=A0A554WZS2_9BURK|nr:hypothetical protein [Tepidimonas charontis]TSE29099.1 TRAP transporter solute receptor, TAXI family [Tepidimonas charontis]
MRLLRHITTVLSVGVALAATTVNAQPAQFINVLTGGQSGVYYPVGVALSQI